MDIPWRVNSRRRDQGGLVTIQSTGVDQWKKSRPHSTSHQCLADAKMLDDASSYYPAAAILDGWAARNDVYEQKKDVLGRVIKAWLPANRDLIEDTDASLKMLQEQKYKDISLADLHTQFKASKLFSAADWATKYKDGTVTKWLQNVTDFYAGIGGMSNPLKASQYFDPSLFLAQVG